MATEQRYRVSEAILVPRGDGASDWRITFTAVGGEALDRLVATIPSDTVEEMSFVETYTRAQIDALTSDPG